MSLNFNFPKLLLISAVLLGQITTPVWCASNETDIEPDEISSQELKQPVTLEACSLDTAEFVKEIGSLAKINLSPNPNIKNIKITASLHQMPIGEVLKGMQLAFGYRVRFYKGSNKFVLYNGDNEQLIAEEKEREDQEFKKRLEGLIKLLSEEPEINAPDNVIERSLTNLGDKELEQLLKGDMIWLPFPTLSPLDQAGIRKIVAPLARGLNFQEPTPPSEADINASGVVFRVERSGKSKTLKGGFLLYGNENLMDFLKSHAELSTSAQNESGSAFLRLGGGNSGIFMGKYDPLFRGFFPGIINSNKRFENWVGTDDIVESSIDVLQPYLITKLLKQPDLTKQPLQKLANFSLKLPDGNLYIGKYNTPLSAVDLYLLSLAKQENINLIADSYTIASLPTLEIKPKEKKIKTPLNEKKNIPVYKALNKVVGLLDYQWNRNGNLFLFRRKYWPEEEGSEPSAQSTRKWVRFWNVRKDLDKPLGAEEIGAFASEFTVPQLYSLGKILPAAQRIKAAAGPFALYFKLDVEKRSKMNSDEGISWKELRGVEKNALINLVPLPVRDRVIKRIEDDQDSRFRIIRKDGIIRSEFTVNAKWLLDLEISDSVKAIYTPKQDNDNFTFPPL